MTREPEIETRENDWTQKHTLSQSVVVFQRGGEIWVKRDWMLCAGADWLC